MKKYCTFFCGIGLMLISCTAGEHSEEENVRTITKEHAALLGEWEERDSTITMWKFDLDEVKWKGFSHMYRLSGDTLTISGITYRVTKHTEEELVLVNLSGKQSTLTRKK